MEEIEANIGGGQTLAVPGLFIYEEDSGDHFDPEEEDDQAGGQEDTEENPTGDRQPQEDNKQIQPPYNEKNAT